jgi:hypothetical protein
MPFPSVIERSGAQSATGFTKETTFGTPVAATSYLPMMSNSLEFDPGWFSPHVMQANRALQVYNLYGEQKFTGAINGPLFPTMGVGLLLGSIGFDAQTGFGVTGTPATTASVTTTSTAAALIGASVIAVTSATGFNVGQTINVDTGLLAETKRIVSISGLNITVDSPFSQNHATGVNVTTFGLTSTTTNGSTIVGATTVVLTSATGFATGQFITVDTGLNVETRRITNVATNTVTVDTAFNIAHASGVPAVTAATTTMSAPSVATATTITVTSATGIVNGTIIQIDVNSVTGGFTSEVRKVTNVATNTLTLDVALTYAHATGSVVTIVSTPFTHTVQDAPSLPSFTIEKNVGNFQSLQFAGTRIGKMDVKAPVGNNPIDITADVTGRSVAILTTPSQVSILNEQPYVFAEANLVFNNNVRSDIRNVNITIDNGLKTTYTYSNNRGPAFITPVTLHVSGSFEAVWSSFNDPTFGDFLQMQQGNLASLNISFVHATTNNTVTLTINQVALNKFANDIKMEDVILSSLNFEASKPVTGAFQNTITATIADTQYLPF